MTLAVTTYPGGAVIDRVTLDGGALRYETGDAKPIFEAFMADEGASAADAYRRYTGWSNGYLVIKESDGAAARSIVAAFDRNQRRGPDGKWIKIGEGLGAVAEAATPARRTRRGLRPTLSDGVKLPPQPPLKVAPRHSSSPRGWYWTQNEDPAERASHFWQGRFSDQQAIRQVFRNMAEGKADPTDGLHLETNGNWDLTYLNIDKPREPGVSYEEWEAEHPNGDPVFDRGDLRNELISAGRWLHESLADAPVTTQPLYRGMRMKRGEVPKVGDTFGADVISWAEERYRAERYASMPEDPEIGRVGDTEVMFRLNGPKRSVDLGPDLLDEHITQGKYRVTKVTGTGRKRFITLEEVADNG